MKLLALIAATFLCGSSTDYVSALRSSEGMPYSDATCSGLIVKAKRHAPCSAREFWEGCSGDLAVILEASSFTEVNQSRLAAGDVLDFGGVHVAAYIGDGSFIDSTPERGVSQFRTVNLRDPWYAGKVRILRWRKS